MHRQAGPMRNSKLCEWLLWRHDILSLGVMQASKNKAAYVYFLPRTLERLPPERPCDTYLRLTPQSA